MDGKLEKPLAVRQTVISNFEKASPDCNYITPSANSAFTKVQAHADADAQEFVGGKAPVFLIFSELRREPSGTEQIESLDTTSEIPQEPKRDSKYLDRILVKARKEIKQQCEELSLPQKLEELAQKVFFEAEKASVNFNKKLSTKKAAAIIFACHLENFHLGKIEVAKTFKASNKEVNKCVKNLKYELADVFEINKSPLELTCSIIHEVFDKKEFLRKELTNEQLVLFKQSAEQIAKNVSREKLLEGKKPKTVAAASIFTAFFVVECSLPREEIGIKIEEAMGTKWNTLCEAYAMLYPFLQQLVPSK